MRWVFLLQKEIQKQCNELYVLVDKFINIRYSVNNKYFSKKRTYMIGCDEVNKNIIKEKIQASNEAYTIFIKINADEKMNKQ